MDLKAAAIVGAFNHMGCDAITVGDDDLLWGKENLLEILERADFPVVSANLIDSGSDNPLFLPYVIRQMEGLRVGIFGLHSTHQGLTEGRYSGITVLDPLTVAPKVASTLKDKADLVILLSHLGYAKDLELAKRVEGISVIVGGHSAVSLSHPRIIQNTVVLQVARKGRRLGRIDIRIKDFSQTFVNVATKEMLRKRLDGIEAQLEVLGKEELQDSAKTTRKKEMLEQRKAETRRILKLSGDQNEVVNRIVPLTEDVADDSECEKVLEPYLLQISEAEKTIGVRP